ncbi:helix-turn-helix domain-containing protein [Micromonospora sp. R77]|uniref:helix-turn-helix domain-containing protein n=1 Tax=Micromonospora sp. R77 TaxID=2925836 RepID=UPI001F60C99D|nr:helix-turn-helix domain-containing protein [Micromonospora sp. R77]MCI4065244.1 helix-turn-helix domain-containing protein [Micromonospora sp. R77]
MNELPVGRRVAQWRVRRNLTQQQFADRLGKSKSWVDKVERGARRLDRMSNLREVAEALRIDLAVLLAQRPERPALAVAGVARVRAALARYHVEASTGRPIPRRCAPASTMPSRAIGTPAIRCCSTCCPACSTPPARPVPARSPTPCWCRCTASPPWRWSRSGRGSWPGWPPTGDGARPGHGGRPVGRRRHRAAGAGVAGRGPAAVRDGGGAPGRPPHHAARVGRRVVAARPAAAPGRALAAAGRGDDDRRLLDQAATFAGTVGGGGVELAEVEAARVVVEVTAGDVGPATVRHQRLLAGDGWRRLPVEHRAAYLLDVARGWAEAGDLPQAGRALLDAERTAPSEVQDRPVAREVLTAVARYGTAPLGLDRLAAALHIT